MLVLRGTFGLGPGALGRLLVLGPVVGLLALGPDALRVLLVLGLNKSLGGLLFLGPNVWGNNHMGGILSYVTVINYQTCC